MNYTYRTVFNEYTGETTYYKITENGTAFHRETSDKVVNIISRIMSKRIRVRIVLGNVETGKVWNEEYDIMGYIGRSTGIYKVPLLVNNARSYGGGALLDNCILGIIDTSDRQWLYKADNIDFGEHSIRQENDSFYLYINGEPHGQFKTEEQAKRYSDFLLCKRNRK